MAKVNPEPLGDTVKEVAIVVDRNDAMDVGKVTPVPNAKSEPLNETVNEVAIVVDRNDAMEVGEVAPLVPQPPPVVESTPNGNARVDLIKRAKQLAVASVSFAGVAKGAGIALATKVGVPGTIAYNVLSAVAYGGTTFFFVLAVMAVICYGQSSFRR